jgi:hypothetical protein
MQIPPGSARASSRAATLTPSPNMSLSSMMMSPTLMPMRNSILLSLEPEVRLFLVKPGQAAVGSHIGC